MAARSVPECGTAGAQGWNIDYLAPTWSSLTSTSWSPSGGPAVERGSGPGRCLTRCWVLKDRATPPAARECGRAGVGGFLLVGGPCRWLSVAGSGVGCRLYFENFTVDASIFVVSSF